MAYEIYQKHGEEWVKISDPTSLINDTLTSSTTTWSSLEMKSRFEALAGNLKVEIVTERPTTGVLNTMYYVGTETPYHIWLYANNTEGNPTWFDMGTTGIALTDYYTKTQADERYLQLTGGTVTGSIISTESYVVRKPDTNGYLTVTSGTNNQNGANIGLNGGTATSGNAGDFIIRATTNGSDTKILRGKPNGSLTWNNKEIAIQDNHYTKTQSDAKYLLLAGGTMSGTITTSVGFALRSNIDNGGLQILGSTAARNGARLVLEGKNSGATGGFTLEAAKSSTEYTQLVGRTGGTLTWGGNTVMTNDVTYTKTEVDTSLATKQKNITYGTSEPTGGVDGDIYIRYEE